MEEGSYADDLDFSGYTPRKFVPHLWNIGSDAGCGATALSLLTGRNPLHIKKKKDWTHEFMTWTLRRAGFKVQKLTKRGLTNKRHIRYPVTELHVVLASLRLIKGEASWVVLHNGMMYHNFDVTSFKGYELINHPMVTAYLIKHKSW